MNDQLEIVILKDNLVGCPGLVPGHGLAMLLELGGTRILFDTGPDETIFANAEALGVSLTPLDAIVLSHGHYDHTGGLQAVLERTGPVRVVAHAGIFDETRSGPDPRSARYIGMPMQRQQYEALGADFELSEMPVGLGGGLMTTGHVPPLHPRPQGGTQLWRRGEGQVFHDSFRDDCSLVARLQDCCAVITGCAHIGLANILYKVNTMLGDCLPRTVIGGLHLLGASPGEVEDLAQEAYALGVRLLMPCHCTGREATQVLRDRFQGEVVPVATGTRISIQDHCRTVVKHAPTYDLV